MAAIALSSTVACLWLVMTISRGLSQAIDLSRKVAAGDLTETVHITRNDEISDCLTSAPMGQIRVI